MIPVNLKALLLLLHVLHFLLSFVQAAKINKTIYILLSQNKWRFLWVFYLKIGSVTLEAYCCEENTLIIGEMFTWIFDVSMYFCKLLSPI